MTFRMPATARPAGLRFRVRDRSRMLAFYRDVLGIGPAGETDGHDGADGALVLGPPGARFRVALDERPDASVRLRGTVGLYHYALLYPDRGALARAVGRVLDAGWKRIEGAADHGVSEAFYLRDPENNGVELYRDRARSRWPVRGEEVAMYTRRLDLDDLVADAGGADREAAPRLGHLHLHTAELERARRFYVDGLGLRVRQSSYPGALFLAAGDYHHHLGLNVWAEGRRAPESATGLRGCAWKVEAGTISRLRAHLEAAGIRVEGNGEEGSLRVVDPDGLRVTVEATETG